MAKKSKKTEADHVYLELDGTVSIVEVKGGVKTKTPIDGNIVLQALLLLMEEAVLKDLMLKIKKKKPKAKK